MKRIIVLTALALALLTGTAAVTVFPTTQAMAAPCSGSDC
jgi:hypothetical protein